MRRSVTISLILCTITLLTLAPRWFTRVNAGGDSHTARAHFWASLDAKAARSQAGDEASVRDLAAGIFKPFGWANRAEIRGRILDRVVKAELAYRSGQHPPVPEDNVVKVVNSLAQQLGAPDYAKTNLDQVRYLRTSLMVSSPHLVASGTRSGEDKEIPRALSPVEATYVVLSLIHQKLYNPKYQEVGDGWLKARHREDVERWEKHREKRLDVNSGPRLVSITGLRVAEMRQVAGRAPMLPTPEALPDMALDDLGVSR
jgi:hypothetical protein